MLGLLGLFMLELSMRHAKGSSKCCACVQQHLVDIVNGAANL